MDPLDLSELFKAINQSHFDGFLDLPEMIWNTRLRASAGRFTPGARRFGFIFPAKIEIATYLREEPNAAKLIRDTLAHEMIHYWLWVRKRPYGHTQEFLQKMKEMGVSRYNSVPKIKPYPFFYQCPACQKEYPSRKRLRARACGACCRSQAAGQYDPRFKLVLLSKTLQKDWVD